MSQQHIDALGIAVCKRMREFCRALRGNVVRNNPLAENVVSFGNARSERPDVSWSAAALGNNRLPIRRTEELLAVLLEKKPRGVSRVVHEHVLDTLRSLLARLAAAAANGSPREFT